MKGLSNRSRLHVVIFLIAASIAWAVINLVTLVRYPLLTCDESFYAMGGSRIINIILGIPTTIPDRNYFEMLLPYGRLNLIGIGLYGLLPISKAFTARLWGFTGWVLAILGTYWTARKLWLANLALWPAALTATAWMMVFYGHNGRPHIWVGAIAIVSLGVLASALDAPRPGLLMLVTALPAFMLDFHLNSIHVLIANTVIASAVLISRGKWKEIGWLVLGGLVVTPVLFVWRFVPRPDDFIHLLRTPNPLSIMSTYAYASVDASILQVLLMRIPQHLVGFINWWIFVYAPQPVGIIQALFFLFGIATAVLHRNRYHRLAAAYYLLIILSFIMLVNYQWTTYAVPWIPVLIVLGVFGVQWLTQLNIPKIPSTWIPWMASGLLGALLLLYLGGDALLLRRPTNDRFFTVAHDLAQRVPPRSTILAETTWWFGLPEASYSDEQLALQGKLPSEVAIRASIQPPALAEQIVRDEIKPDYVLSDQLIGCQDTPTPQALALEDFVAAHCELVQVYSVDRPNGEVREAHLYNCRPDQSMEHQDGGRVTGLD